MFTSPYKFHSFHPMMKPSKILTDYEKETIIHLYNQLKTPFHTIFVDEWLCLQLDARVGDIICMRDNTSDLYREVIARKLR